MRRLLSRLVFIGFCAALCGELLWRGADALFPFPDEELGRPYGQIVVDRKGDVIRMFLAADGRWRFAVHREQMSPELMEAIVASEDRWFRYHPGVNPVSVLRATFSNLRAGRVVSGASTIPMQIARLMQRRPRTLRSKLIEAFRALQMCRLLEKDELLEIYLNLAPYGDNIEGVRAASYFYFGKRPDRLSWAEIALLTTLPRSPIRYDPTRNPELSRRSRNRVIEQLRMGGLMSPSQSRIARSAAVPGRKRQTPFRAPHFAEFLRRRSPGLQDLKSTLDLEIQASVELGVESHVEQLRALGIENAAVVVLDNNTREVLALVGSAAYLDSAHQGQVNGAVARRSPGSALKPFLYALAYDRGHIVPESLLLDVPYDYSGYVPENYDQRYRGQVSAEEALVQSLNVPAVHLLSRTGLVDFHELLLSAGLSTLDRPSLHYGLPLVLGAGEVRLLDLANLYASLARGGVHRPVRLLAGDASTGRRLFSREAVHFTTGSLTRLPRPDLPEAWALSLDVPAVAWKTGTSYGHRDAWAIGFSRERTIGVWLGNFDGAGTRGLSGAEHAGPLLFDLFRAVAPSGSRFEEPKGLEIDQVAVCPVSRQLPGPYCPQTLRVAAIRGRSTFRACGIHQRIFVDAESGLRLDGPCLSSSSYVARVIAVLPPRLAAWRQRQGTPVPVVPERASDCNPVASGEGPRIVSPDRTTPYLLREGVPASYQRISLTALAQPGGRLFWYQDGLLVASGDPEGPFFLSPVRGLHELVVVDAQGRSDRIDYRVE